MTQLGAFDGTFVAQCLQEIFRDIVVATRVELRTRSLMSVFVAVVMSLCLYWLRVSAAYNISGQRARARRLTTYVGS